MNAHAIRQAAILVAALDRDAADALMDQMPEEFAAAVRQCVMELDEIDAHEEQEVIGKFLGLDVKENGPAEQRSPEMEPKANSTVRSLEDYLAEPSVPTQAEESSAIEIHEPPMRDATNVQDQPLKFLHEADDEQLYRALHNDDPQITASVFSPFTAAQAATDMARIPPDDQVDIARRMAVLGEVDAHTLCEIGEALKLRIDPSHIHDSPTGLKAIQSIVSTDRSASQEILQNLHRADASFAQRLAKPQSDWETGSSETSSRSAFQKTASVDAAPSVQCEFEDLLQLNDDDLGRVLKRANGRVVLLATAGASEALTEKVYRQLPRSDAQALRRQIEQQGTFHLRDVETAQEQIGQIAGKLATAGTIQLPQAPRFITAA